MSLIDINGINYAILGRNEVVIGDGNKGKGI